MISDSSPGSPARESTPGTLEEALGSADGRYFAAGYRSVAYNLDDVRPDQSVADGLRAVAAVDYPPRWSVDALGRERTPHLSSVDAIVLPILTLEHAAAPDLLAELCDYRVCAIDLRSGSKPWLKLDSVPVLQHSVELSARSRNIRALVGNIRSSISIVRESSSSPGSADFELGCTRTSVYGGLFKTGAFDTRISAFDPSSATLDASHEFSPAPMPGTVVGAGVESAYWPAPTVIDYLVTMGQLTQALIYESERARLARIGSLWMRSMRIDLNNLSSVRSSTDVSSQTRLLRNRPVMLNGRRVHDVVVESLASSGVHARAALAYEEEGLQ